MQWVEEAQWNFGPPDDPVSPVLEDHETMAAGSPPTETVYQYLLPNYPASTLKWVRQATWRFDPAVPLSVIRMDRRPGGRDPMKVQGIEAALAAGKPMDPVVLVVTDRGLVVADGYHRTLAYRHAGRRTIPAWVAWNLPAHGPWETTMHAHKKNLALMRGHTMLTTETTMQSAILAIQRDLPTTDPHELALDGLLVHALAITYADPKDHAYPIDAAHIRAAITYFGKNAHRYPPVMQRSIAKRILRAAVRHGIEVGEKDRIRTIAEGKGPKAHGTDHPGTSRVTETKKTQTDVGLPGVVAPKATIEATEAKTTNGPAGPHPFPAETEEEQQTRDHDIGMKELFTMIDNVTRWADRQESSQQDDKELALLTSLLGALDGPGDPAEK